MGVVFAGWFLWGRLNFFSSFLLLLVEAVCSAYLFCLGDVLSSGGFR